MLAPLATLAEIVGYVIAAVMHLTKNAGAEDPSPAAWLCRIRRRGACRPGCGDRADPDDPARRLLLPVKNNLAPPADVLAFRRDGDRIVWDTAPVSGVTADNVLIATASDSHERRDAEQFLRDVLSGEPVQATDVLRMSRQNGISKMSLRRAKARLNVKSRLQGFGQNGRWYWWIPTSEAIKTSEAITQKVSISEHLLGRERRSEALRSISEHLLENPNKTDGDTEALNRERTTMTAPTCTR